MRYIENLKNLIFYLNKNNKKTWRTGCIKSSIHIRSNGLPLIFNFFKAINCRKSVGILLKLLKARLKNSS